jgi:hypothetical protein
MRNANYLLLRFQQRRLGVRVGAGSQLEMREAARNGL